ncbi:MAG: 2Fe-2S iron-sulfur cluster-binding protein, partial [Phycisphaeraceae bacterium]|nr:2Fe-2S iron-sulfur cluster-binding protein [Phycisphaeraceae bacterium]
LEDPESLTDSDKAQYTLVGSRGQNLLEIALDADINIEHACGGVCACSTCHAYINEGQGSLSEPEEDEEDRVEEAPGLQHNSRLSCQCIIEGDGPIVVQIPAWNRNAVKEVPH